MASEAPLGGVVARIVTGPLSVVKTHLNTGVHEWQGRHGSAPGHDVDARAVSSRLRLSLLAHLVARVTVVIH